MILYFTGTGNSRFVAEALADQLDDDTVNILPFIKENKAGTFTSDKPYGFVFPIYLSAIPVVVKDFIRRSHFNGNEKCYFFATCKAAMGITPNEASSIIKKNLTDKKYMGSVKINMPQNYIYMFTMTPKEEQEKLYSGALEAVKHCAESIRNGQPLEGKPVNVFEYGITKPVEKMYNAWGTGTKKFSASDACVSCGLCEKNCPMNSIVMENGKPKWIKKCIHCMACVNNCPKQAIECGKRAGKERYVCKKYEKQN